MRPHILNLYKINNLDKIDFSYKLIEFDLDFLNSNPRELKKSLEKIEWQISSDIQGPATVLMTGGKRYVAIPANKTLRITKATAGSVSVSLKELPGIHKLNMAQRGDKMLKHKLLDFEIRNHLQRNDLWSLNTYQFYLKKPVSSVAESDVEIYGGFVYRLIEDNGSYYVAINPTYKYMGYRYLSELVNSIKTKEALERLKGLKCLYQNGDNWYQVEIRGFGKAIAEHEFVDGDGKSHRVKNFIAERTRQHKFEASKLLKDSDLALLYKYPNKDMKDFHGATSLAKIIYSTNEKEVKGLHKKAILPPAKRFGQINDAIQRFFQNMDWNGTKLDISKTPLTEKLRSFPIPSLKYNNEKILSIKSRHNDSGSTELSDFGSDRKKMIKDNHILTQTPFVPQFLVVPATIDIQLAKAFKKHAEEYLRKLAPNFPEFTLITYETKFSDAATIQINEIAKQLEAKNVKTGNVLFLLPFHQDVPNKTIKNFHDCLKKKFFPNIKFQCASLSKIETYYETYVGDDRQMKCRVKLDLVGMYQSYLFNLMMEYLIVNRKWPFALVNNLNYDIYIGIDVHERFAGFSFFYKNGENIFFDYQPIPNIAGDVRRRAEKLKVEVMLPKLIEKLEMQIPLYAQNPNGIVIIRDGRSFGQEEIALKKAIDHLHAKGIVNKDTIKWGVLDLHKKTATPIRLAAVQTNGFDKLVNPIAGTYRIFDGKHGFIFNTGYPFQIRGTANPVHITMKDGNIDFEKALEDVFAQSIMSFSAPDKPNSLPICIKLIDSFLAPVAAHFQDIDDEVESEVINEEEFE